MYQLLGIAYSVKIPSKGDPYYLRAVAWVEFRGPGAKKINVGPLTCKKPITCKKYLHRLFCLFVFIVINLYKKYIIILISVAILLFLVEIIAKQFSLTLTLNFSSYL